MWGELHGTNAPASRLHANVEPALFDVKLKLAERTAVSTTVGGPLVNVTSGGGFVAVAACGVAYSDEPSAVVCEASSLLPALSGVSNVTPQTPASLAVVSGRGRIGLALGGRVGVADDRARAAARARGSWLRVWRCRRRRRRSPA